MQMQRRITIDFPLPNNVMQRKHSQSICFAGITAKIANNWIFQFQSSTSNESNFSNNIKNER